MPTIHFGRSYRSSLSHCNIGLRLEEVTPEGRIRSWNELTKLRAKTGMIFPGDFIRLGDGPPKIILNDDEDYDALAFDTPNNDALLGWLWTSPGVLPRIGIPRLDRIADLAVFVRVSLDWYRENPRHPMSGYVPHGRKTPIGVTVLVRKTKSNQSYLVCDHPEFTDPKLRRPISMFGRLEILGTLLQEKARDLCRICPDPNALVRLSEIAMDPQTPAFWKKKRIADLEAVPAELLRCVKLLPGRAQPKRRLSSTRKAEIVRQQLTGEIPFVGTRAELARIAQYTHMSSLARIKGFENMWKANELRIGEERIERGRKHLEQS